MALRYRRAVATLVACAIVVVAATAGVNAQSGTSDETGARTQLGTSTGVLLFLPTLGARLTVPFRPRLAIEGVGEYVPWTFDEERAIHLLLQVQLRHQVRRGRSWRMHGTYGTTFFGKYRVQSERRDPRVDGSVLVFPAYRRFRIESPPILHAGVGGQRPISDRAVVRWDVQGLVPLRERAYPFPRATVGVSWQGGSSR
jgi:hypothetical protein